MIDEIDRKILVLLQKNCRLSIAEIGEQDDLLHDQDGNSYQVVIDGIEYDLATSVVADSSAFGTDTIMSELGFEVEGNNPDKALLSRDEYVIPADVVAMLGNGSSNAGSEQLDGFIKGIRQDSFGTQRQQQQLNAQQGLRGLV